MTDLKLNVNINVGDEICPNGTKARIERLQLDLERAHARIEALESKLKTKIRLIGRRRNELL